MSFQGAESGLALWLNGHYIGYAEDSFTPSEFELTEFIDPEGENKLSAQVFRFTAGSWCEDQDFFRFSGIFRDVYLYAIPDVHIRDLKIQTLLSEDYRDAVLSVDFDCIGDGRAELNLYDGDEVIARGKAALTGGTAHVSIPVAAPKKWSAEKPNLYRLEIEIREYMVACYGTTEYTENMTGITLGAVDKEGCRQYIDYEYKCRDLAVPGAECVSASVPQIKTKVSMHSFGGAVGIVREGYAFSPMFTLGYNKNVRNGEVFTTWLRLEREN